METSILGRESFLNPFVFEGRQITSITFYNKDGEICTLKRGWFGETNNQFDSFTVPLIKVKRKKDFNHKGCFVLPSPTLYNTRGYDLYIGVDNENVKLTCGKSEKDMGTDKFFYNNYLAVILGVSVWFNIIDKVERTPKGIEVDKWDNILSKQGIKINRYELELLLEKYNLVEK